MSEPLPAIPGYIVFFRLGGRPPVTSYRARDERTGRFVCLQLFENVLTAADIDHFRRTAWPKVRELSHPGLVPVYDCGMAGPYAYLASELVDGRDLRSV